MFERLEGVSVRYVSSVQELGQPDMIFLPGSKNTMGDLHWMRQNGLETAVKKLAVHIPGLGDLRRLSDAGAYHFGPTWGRE